MAKKKIFLCLFLLLLSLFPFSLCVQAEKMYTIYESELTTLENNSQKLLENNEKKEKLLNEQKEQLNTANALIEKLKESNEQTETSLEKIKKSYEEYEKEAERKIRIKTRQRNLWIAVSIGVGILAAR